MQTSATDRPADPASTDDAIDAIELLQHDHRKVQMLFGSLESLRNAGSIEPDARRRLVEQICRELAVHAQIEEEIFYPAVREAAPDAQVERAEHEHAEAEALIEELRAMPADHERFDATVLALGKAVMQHVQEEESEMFAQARGRIDAAALGRQLMQRRQALQQDDTGPTDRA